MTERVAAIMTNTLREAVRNKIVYVILGAVVALNLFSLVLGQMSLNEQGRIARDAGLAGVSLFGVATAIYIGVATLYAEINKRTIHVILAKPIRRFEFVLGKYLGMSATLTLLIVAFGVTVAGLLALSATPFTAALLQAILLRWLELLIVAAVAIFFSSFSTPFMSGTFTLGIFAIGRSWAEMQAAAERSKDVLVRNICRAALWVVPDLHLYTPSGGEVDGKAVSVHGAFVSWAYVGHAALYALAVVAVLLLLGMAIFQRRDFA
jgi:ABC-type transport system involved in multi-copper enzyme maturation permease subunit